MEPDVSEPIATGAKLALTETQDPADEPDECFIIGIH